MNHKIRRIVGLCVALTIILSACSGIVWNVSAETVIEKVYYVSENGSDSAEGTSDNTALATVNGVIQKAKNDYPGLSAADTVKAYVSGNIAWGASLCNAYEMLASHDFTLDLQKAPNTTATPKILHTDSFNSRTTMGGPVKISSDIYVDLTTEGAEPYFALGACNAVIHNDFSDSNIKLVLGNCNAGKTVNDSLDITLSTPVGVVYAGSTYGKTTYNAPVTVRLNTGNQISSWRWAGDSSIEKSVYINQPFNILINATSGVKKFDLENLVTLNANGGVQVINHNKNSVINISSVAAACKKVWVLNTDGTEKIAATAILGEFAVEHGWQAVAVSSKGTSVSSEDGVLKLDTAGQYSVAFEKAEEEPDEPNPPIVGENGIYYVAQNASGGNGTSTKPFATIEEVIHAANGAGCGAGDTITAILNGTVKWSTQTTEFTLPEYAFKLVLQSNGDSTADVVTAAAAVHVNMGGDIEIAEDVTIDMLDNKALIFNGHNVILNAPIIKNHAAIAFGKRNTPGVFDREINVVFNGIPTSNGTAQIVDYRIANTYNKATYNQNYTIVMNAELSNSYLRLADDNKTSHTTYNRGLNFILNQNVALAFANLGASVTFGENGGIQVINNAENAVHSKTFTDASFNADHVWILNGANGKVAVTDQAGTYTVTKGLIASAKSVADGSVTTSQNGVLALPAGEYSLSFIGENSTIVDMLEQAEANGAVEGTVVPIDITGRGSVAYGLASKTYPFAVAISSNDLSDVVISPNTALACDTVFDNVDVISGDAGNLYLAGFDTTFTSKATISGFTRIFTGNQGVKTETFTYNGQKVVVGMTACPDIFIGSNNEAGSGSPKTIYNQAFDIIIDNSTISNKIVLGREDADTLYNANLNINVKKAKTVNIDDTGKFAFGSDSVMQIIRNADANCRDKEGTSAYAFEKATYYVIDRSNQRAVLDCTETAGCYKVNTTAVVYAKHALTDTIVPSVNGMLNLTEQTGEWEISSTKPSSAPTEVEGTLNDLEGITDAEFLNEWNPNSIPVATNGGSGYTLADGQLTIANQSYAYGYDLYFTPNHFQSKNQYFSVDVTGEDIVNEHRLRTNLEEARDQGRGISLYGRFDKSTKQSYEYKVLGNRVILTKRSGVKTNSSNKLVPVSKSFSYINHGGSNQQTIDDASTDWDLSAIRSFTHYTRFPESWHEGNMIPFKEDHTYRMGMSVIDGQGTVAYVRIILTDLTTNSLILDEVFKDSNRYNHESFAFAAHNSYSNDDADSTKNTSKVTFDNLWVSTEGFMDGSLGQFGSSNEFAKVGQNEAAATNLRNKITANKSSGMKNGYYYPDMNNENEKYQIKGNVYYVSSDPAKASENNNGTSAQTPWTLEKLNQQIKNKAIKGTSTANIAILFERGSVFYLSTDSLLGQDSLTGQSHDYLSYLIAREYMTFGAYGSGEMPVFDGGARNYADVAWKVSEKENVYYLETNDFNYGSKRVQDHNPINIVFDNGQKVGARKFFSPDLYTLCEDGHFTYDDTNKRIYLYCKDGVPDQVYHHISIARGIYGVTIHSGASNVNFDSLSFQLFGAGAIRGLYKQSYITVSNCEIGYSGGMMYVAGTSAARFGCRYGNAIEMWGDAPNFSVKNSWIYHTFDSAITPQFSSASNSDNFTVENCLFEYNNADIEYFDSSGSSGTFKNAKINNNIFRFTTLGWGSRESDKIRGIQGVIRIDLRHTASSATIEFKNNIVDTPGMEIFNMNNTLAGGSLFKFGNSIGNNSYYINDSVRNRKYIAILFKNSSSENANRSAETASVFKQSISAIDTSATSKYYWYNTLIG